MTELLSAVGKAALEEVARSNVLLGFDYDGTLAPIVERPEDAVLGKRTRALLAAVIERYPCAVVSGRARADVVRFLEGLPLLRIVGNHGMEWDHPPKTFSRRAVVRWREAVRRACTGLDGVFIEDKTWSLAVHFRGSGRKAEVKARVRAVAASLRDVRVVPGKNVLNLVHRDAADKGTAILEIKRQLGCDTVIFFGDDVTDEDVFALAEPGRLLAVRVGKSVRSRAEFYVRSQARMDAVLEHLIALRPARRKAAAR